MLHPGQFAVNEAWIAFQLNREPLQTEQDGPLNCVALMDAASCFILGTEIVTAQQSELSLKEARTLLGMGRRHHQQLPKLLFIATSMNADSLEVEATKSDIQVKRVPESDLLIFTREARDGFEQHLATRGRDA